jgi:hypothetical protein
MGRRETRKSRQKRAKKEAAANKPSRKQRFREKQRSTWLAFLGKLLLFFVPAVFLTWWLIMIILSQGEPLYMLTLDLGAGNGVKEVGLLKVSTYGKDRTEDEQFGLPKKVDFGGPQKNALLIFNDLLGSARKFEGKLEPCVFIPKDNEEHKTHALYGIPDEESDLHKQQWLPFEDYVHGLVRQIHDKNRSSGDEKKVILVFDVDHPDFAGRLPPQVNPFIRLCKENWNDLRARLASEFSDIKVFIWLSHDNGQKSYWDSNPKMVESLFKHRFELGLSGDIYNVVRELHGSRDVAYSDLRDYLKDLVADDARGHNLVQHPTFLEPESFEDFPLLRYQKASKAEPIFSYQQRGSAAELDKLWRDFEDAKRKFSWELENPLSIQQANVLLLQMERLWYEGQTSSVLFKDFKKRLESLFKTDYGVEPVVHSLQDKLALTSDDLEQILATVPLEDDWLQPFTLPPEDADPKEREAAADKLDKRTRGIKKWKAAYSDWKSAMKVWQTLLQSSGQPNFKAMVGEGIGLLTPSQTITEQSGSKLEFNEVVYLRRIHNELEWIEDQGGDTDAFNRLVGLSLMARDQSNRMVTQFQPLLVQQFGDRFDELEARRRWLEDRLFAHEDLDGVMDELVGLNDDYKSLDNQKDKFADRFKRAQSSLVNACHEFRYQVERASYESSGQRNGGWIEKNEQSEQRLAAFEIGQFETPDGNDVPEPSPYGSLANLEKNLGSLGVADGNLKARHLLFWPGLKLSQRESLHAGLAKNTVTKDDTDLEGSNGGPTENQGFTDDELKTLVSKMESGFVDDFTLIEDSEVSLLKTAQRSNRYRLFGISDSVREQNLARFINGFHVKKSHLVFNRIARDLWGTPQDSRAFVETATQHHRTVSIANLESLCGSMSDPKNDFFREFLIPWNSVDKQWDRVISGTREFSRSFDSWNWEYSNAASRECFSDRMSRSFRTERENRTSFDKELMFSIRSNANNELLIGKSQVNIAGSQARLGLPENVAKSGKNVTVYLRGHQSNFVLDSGPMVALDDVLTSLVMQEGIKGTRLIIDRAPNAETKPLGDVSILIDCSGSMKRDSRLPKVKGYVKSFLKSASERRDINVAIFAFGVSDLTDRDGVFIPKPLVGSKFKRLSPKDDVWRYPREAASKKLDPASVDGFLEAVDQLHSHGETPIVAALDHALNGKDRNGDKPHLVVLLTDGIEFTKERENKFQRPFDGSNRTYQAVNDKIRSDNNTLVIFNMVAGGVDRSDDEGKFQSVFGLNLPKSEILNRLGLIEALAEENATDELGKLRRFLNGVLPRPQVTRNPRFEDESYPEIKDKKRADLKQIIQLGSEDRPKNWELLLQFEPDTSIRAFKKAPVAWEAKCQNFGNEVLEFRYDPLLRKFFLFTEAWKPDADDKEFVLANGQELQIRDRSENGDKPKVFVTSKDGMQLTPTPALTWLELADQQGKSRFLVQDFDLRRQQSSNVHPISFPEIQRILENRSLVRADANLDMKLVWMELFRKDAWAMVDVSQIDDEQSIVKNENGAQIAAREGFSVKLDGLLPKNGEFAKFDFGLWIKNTSARNSTLRDEFTIKLEIQSPKGKPLDQWLVQLLAANGEELHRTCRRETKRVYGLDGTSGLVKMTHEFVVSRKEFNPTGGGAILGIAHIDDIQSRDKQLPTVTFPKKFQAME